MIEPNEYVKFNGIYNRLMFGILEFYHRVLPYYYGEDSEYKHQTAFEEEWTDAMFIIADNRRRLWLWLWLRGGNSDPNAGTMESSMETIKWL